MLQNNCKDVNCDGAAPRRLWLRDPDGDRKLLCQLLDGNESWHGPQEVWSQGLKPKNIQNLNQQDSNVLN